MAVCFLHLITILSQTAETIAKGSDHDDIVTIQLCNGEETIISKCDYARVMQHRWRDWGGYATNAQIGSLHSFIIGPRPEDIPQHWVIDHIDRNKMHNSRPNLRWVCKGFNIWNTEVKANSSSRFKGVYWEKNSKKWAAKFRNKHIGLYSIERDAAKAYAKRVIEFWPIWASTSDLLVGPNLLSKQEIRDIKSEIETGTDNSVQRVLPRGVHKNFRAMHCGKSLGSYKTSEEAHHAYEMHVAQAEAAKWATHLQVPILRDADGDAVIELSGAAALGQFTKVPDRFWHRLTYKTKWNLRGPYAAGTFENDNTYLHMIVYRLCHPDKPLVGTIDHRKSAEKLNNLESNLRDATNTIQSHNHQKQINCTSRHVGVYRHKTTGKWIGRISVNRKRYCTAWMSDEETAARALESIKEGLNCT